MDKLTEEQKRIKLAEFEGWRQIPIDSICGGFWYLHHWTEAADLPNYFHDLNAVAKLEEKLDGQIKSILIDNLERGFQYPWLAHFASATQRSEAIGITLGLWKEGE